VRGRKAILCGLAILLTACAHTGGNRSKDLDSGEYTFIRGMNLYQKGQKREALDVYLRAYEKTPRNPVLVKEIGLLYGESGDYDKALEFFQKAEKLDKRDRNVRENLAYLYYRKGDGKRAMEQIRQIPNGPREAIEKLLREADDGGDDGLRYLLLTRLYLETGEREKAGDSYRLVPESAKNTADYAEIGALLK